MVMVVVVVVVVKGGGIVWGWCVVSVGT
jgi:hypothetical protein